MAEIIGNLGELTGILHRSARQQALDVEMDALRRAQEVQERGHDEAEKLRDEILSAGLSEISEERRRVLARVALEVHRQRLVAREALLSQVWAEAERRLRELPAQPTYGEALRRLAFAAAAVLRQGTIILAADPTGHSLLTSEVLAQWSAAANVRFERAERPAPIWGGLLARDGDTRRQVDASFATRLSLAHAESREKVARILGVL